ncbi:unnamed protein product [Lota lota]
MEDKTNGLELVAFSSSSSSSSSPPNSSSSLAYSPACSFTRSGMSAWADDNREWEREDSHLHGLQHKRALPISYHLPPSLQPRELGPPGVGQVALGESKMYCLFSFGLFFSPSPYHHQPRPLLAPFNLYTVQGGSILYRL